MVTEAQEVASHLFQSDLGHDDCVNLSGGEIGLADDKKRYVVQLNGGTDAETYCRWAVGRFSISALSRTGPATP